MKKLLLFGSTGSIGRNVLDVVSKNPNRFRVELLSCRANTALLIEQARRFSVGAVHIFEESEVAAVKASLPPTTRIFVGREAVEEIIQTTPCDLVVNAIVGAAGLEVSYHALSAGRALALANKESLVAGGELLCNISKQKSAQIIPIDSEHSAIFQCLRCGSSDEVEKIILTASGGPFRTRSLESFSAITVQEALNHPNWSMGSKITIDSATMMNKALEVIEAHFLFELKPEQIDVIIHPESIIHSMVQFADGSTIAQMSPPDMRLPIAYALSYPERMGAELPRTDFNLLRRLTFEAPDYSRFPALTLGYKALTIGGTAALRLNAANEVAVAAFLAGRIKFTDITSIVAAVLAQPVGEKADTLEKFLAQDIAAREIAENFIVNGTLTMAQG